MSRAPAKTATRRRARARPRRASRLPPSGQRPRPRPSRASRRHRACARARSRAAATRAVADARQERRRPARTRRRRCSPTSPATRSSFCCSWNRERSDDARGARGAARRVGAPPRPTVVVKRSGRSRRSAATSAITARRAGAQSPTVARHRPRTSTAHRDRRLHRPRRDRAGRRGRARLGDAEAARERSGSLAGGVGRHDHQAVAAGLSVRPPARAAQSNRPARAASQPQHARRAARPSRKRRTTTREDSLSERRRRSHALGRREVEFRFASLSPETTGARRPAATAERRRWRRRRRRCEERRRGRREDVGERHRRLAARRGRWRHGARRRAGVRRRRAPRADVPASSDSAARAAEHRADASSAASPAVLGAALAAVARPIEAATPEPSSPRRSESRVGHLGVEDDAPRDAAVRRPRRRRSPWRCGDEPSPGRRAGAGRGRAVRAPEPACRASAATAGRCRRPAPRQPPVRAGRVVPAAVEARRSRERRATARPFASASRRRRRQVGGDPASPLPGDARNCAAGDHGVGPGAAGGWPRPPDELAGAAADDSVERARRRARRRTTGVPRAAIGQRAPAACTAASSGRLRAAERRTTVRCAARTTASCEWRGRGAGRDGEERRATAQSRETTHSARLDSPADARRALRGAPALPQGAATSPGGAPRGAPRAAPPAATSCGLASRVDGDRVADAGFDAAGCGADDRRRQRGGRARRGRAAARRRAHRRRARSPPSSAG